MPDKYKGVLRAIKLPPRPHSANTTRVGKNKLIYCFCNLSNEIRRIHFFNRVNYSLLVCYTYFRTPHLAISINNVVMSQRISDPLKQSARTEHS